MTFLPDWPPGVSTAAAFGLLLFVGALGGYLAHRVSWLPSITGFMAMGFVIGPGGLNLLRAEAIADARTLVDVALALILYRLGQSLDLPALAAAPRQVAVSVAESGLTFVLVLAALALAGVPPSLAALVASIAVSSSPAVLIHVAHEEGASGPVTDTAKSLLALNNLLSFVAFTAVLPLMHWRDGADWTQIVLQPLYQLAGSAALAAVLGLVLFRVALATRSARQYRFALIIGAIMLSLGLAAEFRLSTLLTPLALGLMVRALERKPVLTDVEFGEAFELFFIVLFVFAGANLHLRELLQYWPLVLLLVGVRVVAKVGSAVGGGLLTGASPRAGLATGLLLVPMAGLAIGLVQASANLFPRHAELVSAVVLGSVTVFELIGPPLASLAFRLAGETGRDAPSLTLPAGSTNLPA